MNLNQERPTKKMVFLVKSYKIVVIITSLIEMIELLNLVT